MPPDLVSAGPYEDVTATSPPRSGWSASCTCTVVVSTEPAPPTLQTLIVDRHVPPLAPQLGANIAPTIARRPYERDMATSLPCDFVVVAFRIAAFAYNNTQQNDGDEARGGSHNARPTPPILPSDATIIRSRWVVVAAGCGCRGLLLLSALARSVARTVRWCMCIIANRWKEWE